MLSHGVWGTAAFSLVERRTSFVLAEFVSGILMLRALGRGCLQSRIELHVPRLCTLLHRTRISEAQL